MGILREDFIGNPNKLVYGDEDDIEYFSEEEENMMFGQYINLDILLDSDDDEDFNPDEESFSDSEIEYAATESSGGDNDSQSGNDDDTSPESDPEATNITDKKTNDLKTSENSDANASET